MLVDTVTSRISKNNSHHIRRTLRSCMHDRPFYHFLFKIGLKISFLNQAHAWHEPPPYYTARTGRNAGSQTKLSARTTHSHKKNCFHEAPPSEFREQIYKTHNLQSADGHIDLKVPLKIYKFKG